MYKYEESRESFQDDLKKLLAFEWVLINFPEILKKKKKTTRKQSTLGKLKKWKNIKNVIVKGI